MIVQFRGRTMELQKIERFDPEIAKTAFNPLREIFPAVTFDRLLGQLPSGFGGNDDLLFSLFSQLRNQALAATVAINISCIYKVDPAINSAVEGGQRLLIGYVAPEATYGPGAKAYF